MPVRNNVKILSCSSGGNCFSPSSVSFAELRSSEKSSFELAMPLRPAPVMSVWPEIERGKRG